MSSSRSARILAGRPVFAATSAQAAAISGGLGLLAAERRRPSGGPRRSRRRCCRPSSFAIRCWTSLGCWVELTTWSWPCLARRGERGLAFEVEMLLPAHFERARQAVRRGGERGLGVAARHDLRSSRSRSPASSASAMVTRAGSGSVSTLPAGRRRGRRGCWSRRRRTAAGRDRGSRPRRRAGRRGRPGRHCSRRGCRRR